MLQRIRMAGTSENEYQILRYLVCSRGWYYTNRYVGEGNEYLCLKCYKEIPDASDFCGEFCHQLMDIQYGIKQCSRCLEDVMDERSVLSCRQCKKRYYEDIRPLELLGYTSRLTWAIIERFI